jgi:hypothetical protein
MRDYDIARDIAAQCQRKAEAAYGEDDRHSWLALADSWLQTAELKQTVRGLEPGQNRASTARAA